MKLIQVPKDFKYQPSILKENAPFTEEISEQIELVFEECYDLYLSESGWHDEYHTDSDKEILLESFSTMEKLEYIQKHKLYGNVPKDFNVEELISKLRKYPTLLTRRDALDLQTFKL